VPLPAAAPDFTHRRYTHRGHVATNTLPAAMHLPSKGLVGHWSGEGDARDSAGRNHGIIKAPSPEYGGI